MKNKKTSSLNLQFDVLSLSFLQFDHKQRRCLTKHSFKSFVEVLVQVHILQVE